MPYFRPNPRSYRCFLYIYIGTKYTRCIPGVLYKACVDGLATTFLRHENHCMTQTTRAPFFCLFCWAIAMAGGGLTVHHLCGVEMLNSVQGEWSYHVVYTWYFVYGKRHARGRYVVYPLLSLEVASTDKNSIYWTLSSTCKKVRLKSAFH